MKKWDSAKNGQMPLNILSRQIKMVETAPFRIVSEINANWPFTEKSKMAAKVGGRTSFCKSIKVQKSPYFAMFLRYEGFSMFIVKKNCNV